MLINVSTPVDHFDKVVYKFRNCIINIEVDRKTEQLVFFDKNIEELVYDIIFFKDLDIKTDPASTIFIINVVDMQDCNHTYVINK